MKFIINFIKTIRMDSIYKERARLIINTFPEKIEKISIDENSTLFPSIVNMFSTAAKIWSKCFDEAPSAFDNYNCDECGHYTKNVATIWLREQKRVCEEGYEALGKYLQQMSSTSQTTCNRCKRTCNVDRVYNHHVYVGLELRKDLRSQLMTCKLSDLEKSLEFSFNNNSFR